MSDYDKWEQQPKEMKDTLSKESPKEKEYLPEYEIKVSSGTTLSQLKKVYEKEWAIQFLATTDLSIWLTDKGHLDIASKDRIQFSDMSYRGLVRKRHNKVTFQFYYGLEPALQKVIEETISNFLEQK